MDIEKAKDGLAFIRAVADLKNQCASFSQNAEVTDIKTLMFLLAAVGTSTSILFSLLVRQGFKDGNN